MRRWFGRSRPGPKIPPLSVTDAQRAVLEGWVRRRTTAQALALALRSRIVLECAEGHSIMEVSRLLRITADTVRTWRRRFLGRGLDGLCDEPRPGVPWRITDADAERVIVKTLQETPKNAAHWFKLSTDPLFIDKVRDVVGRYLDPPEKALVLCVDEKSQIQALDRSEPVLPMVPGVPERRSHDYVRAGTTTLFAAPEAATGKVIGFPAPAPPGRRVHEVLHFRPTSSSWLNLVKRWFAELTQKKLKQGVHRSVQALERDIRDRLAAWNEHPWPFAWTKTADEILDKAASYCRRISDSGH
ncbi:helix-turn-helix domain-containing protein [Streptomyces sp. NPDC002838]|uniref:helix-turn-helix domain-containing protein n=1 Tax=Streptomyces sp. NPDC002838 TaxID=3154436 RepID=UPI0033332F19